jgi:two-component system CheB/CheR fusion protein
MTHTPSDFSLSLEDVLNSISDAFITIDAGWRIRYVNAAYLKLVLPLFASADELVGKDLWEVFPDIVESEAGKFYREVMASQTQGTLELFYPRLKRWLEVRAFPTRQMLSVFARDVSARKEHEMEVAALTRKVREQSTIFDAVLSHLSDLVYAFDREARVLYANKPLLEIWGRSLEEAVGRTLFELDYPPDLAVRLNDQLLRVVATGRAERGETVYKGLGGADDIHDYIFNPIIDADGKVVGVAGTTRLVTAVRQTERAARQLAAIVESSDDAIISLSLDGTIRTWNRGAEKLLGYTAEEMIDRSVQVIIPEDRANEEHEILARIRNGEQIQHYETTRRRKEGTLVPLSLSVSPIRDDQGNVVGASKIARDISAQKRTERALQEAKEAAEQANRSKDHFLAVLSHELRTPLTPVLMSVAARQLDPKLPEDLRRDFSMIRRNIELETKLIDDLLDLSRITSGKLNLRLAEMDINSAVEHACEVCLPQIFEKGIKLTQERASGVLPVEADFARLQQVLWNLLNNAAKFTPEGGFILVRTAREFDRALVTVSDNGAGIAPEILPRIFDAFEQGGVGITRQFGGMGLGLAISKALVELHGGSIRAQSAGAGQGSLFEIALPLTSSAARAGADALSPRRQTSGTLRLLIVEDHADTAAMLKTLLERSGHTVQTAGSVASALAVAERETFDLLISDVGLPDASGYALMREVAGRHKLRGIAMSGYGMDEDVRKSLEAGFSAHLVKPVDITALEQTIHQLVFGK